MGTVSNITITFTDIKDARGTLCVENEGLINSIFANYKNQSLTSSQYQELKILAKQSGDANVLESSDIKSGRNVLQAKIATDNAHINKGFFNTLQGGTWGGDIYVKVAKGTTMGNIKAMFNLPDGALRNFCNVSGAPGGNLDRHSVGDAGIVWFSIEDFAKGNNMTVDEVKEMFK